MSFVDSEPSDQSSGLIICADSTTYDANDAHDAASPFAVAIATSFAQAMWLAMRPHARRGQALVEYVLIFLLVVIVVVVLLTLLAPYINSVFHSVAPAL